MNMDKFLNKRKNGNVPGMKLLSLAVTGIALSLIIGCEPSEQHSDQMSFDEDTREQIVTGLLSARESKQTIPPVSERHGEFSIEEAYRIQELLTSELEQKYGAVTGYKIGFATPEDFDRLGIEEPAWGHLYADYEVENGGVVSVEDFILFHIENELVFVIDERIEQRIENREQLKPYIRSVHAGFDIADNVYDQDYGITVSEFIANGVGAARFVVGPPVSLEAVDDLDDLILTLHKDGEKEYEGPSTKVLGSPWNIMKWLANDLIDRGHYLEAGDVVLTGKVAPAVRLASKDAHGEYVGTTSNEQFGRVTITVE